MIWTLDLFLVKVFLFCSFILVVITICNDDIKLIKLYMIASFAFVFVRVRECAIIASLE